MKYLFLLLGLLINAGNLNAQVQKLAVHQIVSSYQLDLVNDTLILNNDQSFPLRDDKLSIGNARLTNNELLINYHLADPGENGYYLIRLEIESADYGTIQMQPGLLFGDIGKVDTGWEEGKQIIWTNLADQLPASNDSYQVIVEVEWWGLQFLPYGVICDEYPTFGLKQKLPYFAGLVVGAGGIIAGTFIKSDAQKHFENHKLAATLSERSGEYNLYTDRLKSAETITYVGIGLIAATTALSLLRNQKHKKRVRVYEEFCKQEQLSIHPFWDLPDSKKASAVGVHLTYQF